jgi:3-dehydroquinate synthase
MKPDFSVHTQSGNYPVFVRNTLEESLINQVLEPWASDHILLIIDENVEKHYGSYIRKLAAGVSNNHPAYIVPSGEDSKKYEKWKDLTDFLLNHGARRNTPVLVFGGGVTGDLAGFAASSVMRGLPLIHVPTTLLAMVDSSIGGKTGINHPLGKNLIGSFYQPKAIIMNTGFLKSLPEKEWINGLSEILKYAAIKDQSIFKICQRLFMKQEMDPGHPLLNELIRKCAKIKADIVKVDEKESGLRMILNFGHTFAHALENISGYNVISHGEAVFIGMIAATQMSNKLGANIDEKILEQFKNLYSIDLSITDYKTDILVEKMYKDKKRLSDDLKLILLHDWSEPYVKETRETELISDAWNYAFKQIALNK